MKGIKLIAKFIEPNRGGCSNNSCPAIIEADDGNFIVIGKKPTGSEDLNGLACVADDELMVIVPREIILKLKEELNEISI